MLDGSDPHSCISLLISERRLKSKSDAILQITKCLRVALWGILLPLFVWLVYVNREYIMILCVVVGCDQWPRAFARLFDLEMAVTVAM